MLPMRRFAERSKQQLENMTKSRLWSRNGSKDSFGHVSRSSGLAKTILQDIVKGKRKKRQTEEEVGRKYKKVDRNGLCQLNSSSYKQNKMERDCCQLTCGAPVNLQDYGIE